MRGRNRGQDQDGEAAYLTAFSDQVLTMEESILRFEMGDQERSEERAAGKQVLAQSDVPGCILRSAMTVHYQSCVNFLFDKVREDGLPFSATPLREPPQEVQQTFPEGSPCVDGEGSALQDVALSFSPQDKKQEPLERSACAGSQGVTTQDYATEVQVDAILPQAPSQGVQHGRLERSACADSQDLSFQEFTAETPFSATAHQVPPHAAQHESLDCRAFGDSLCKATPSLIQHCVLFRRLPQVSSPVTLISSMMIGEFCLLLVIAAV